MFEKLTNDNIVMFAIKHYDNPQCEGESEFQDDMKRFKYVKRLLRKYKDSGELKERLILNHLIVIFNVFTQMLVLPYSCSKSNQSFGMF